MSNDSSNKTPAKKQPESKQSRKTHVSGWGPVSAILVTLGVYFGSQILVGVVLGIYVGLSGLNRTEALSLLEDSIVVQFIYILGVAVLSLLLLRIFLKKRSISFRDIGLKKPTFDNILLALPVFVVYFGVLIAAISLTSSLIPSIDLDQEQQIGFDDASGYIALSLVFISLVILPALVEEIMVRGFLYGGLVKKFSKLSASLIASFIFAVAHLQLGSGVEPLWIAAIDTFILSMFLIWLRIKTGNLWAGIAVHAIKNSIAFITLFILKTG